MNDNPTWPTPISPTSQWWEYLAHFHEHGGYSMTYLNNQNNPFSQKGTEGVVVFIPFSIVTTCINQFIWGGVLRQRSSHRRPLLSLLCSSSFFSIDLLHVESQCAWKWSVRIWATCIKTHSSQTLLWSFSMPPLEDTTKMRLFWKWEREAEYARWWKPAGLVEEQLCSQHSRLMTKSYNLRLS